MREVARENQDKLTRLLEKKEAKKSQSKDQLQVKVKNNTDQLVQVWFPGAEMVINMAKDETKGQELHSHGNNILWPVMKPNSWANFYIWRGSQVTEMCVVQNLKPPHNDEDIFCKDIWAGAGDVLPTQTRIGWTPRKDLGYDNLEVSVQDILESGTSIAQSLDTRKYSRSSVLDTAIRDSRAGTSHDAYSFSQGSFMHAEQGIKPEEVIGKMAPYDGILKKDFDFWGQTQPPTEVAYASNAFGQTKPVNYQNLAFVKLSEFDNIVEYLIPWLFVVASFMLALMSLKKLQHAVATSL